MVPSGVISRVLQFFEFLSQFQLFKSLNRQDSHALHGSVPQNATCKNPLIASRFWILLAWQTSCFTTSSCSFASKVVHLLWYQTKSELLQQKSWMSALDLNLPIFSSPPKRLAVQQRPRLPSSWRSWRRPIPHVEIDGEVGNSPRRRVGRISWWKWWNWVIFP